MKLYLLAAILSTGVTHVAYAESLAIGGIELHLGQKADEALHALSPYQVQYLNSGSWLVTQKTGDLYQVLGVISAKNNVVDFISKTFNMDKNEDAPEVYTRASKELRQLGGINCITSETEYTDDLIHGFTTQCGRYKLSYTMPWSQANDKSIVGGIYITIRR